MAVNNNCEETDNFKPIFKFYKNNDYLKSGKEREIIDFLNINRQNDIIREIAINSNTKSIESPISDDFRDIKEWKMFAINAIEGLLVIPQILKKDSSKKWFKYLLEEMPSTQSGDLRANIALPPTQPVDRSNLRWISFGYHHNWETKVYEHSAQSPVPLLIEQMSEYVSQKLGFQGFRGEAGLINYYRHNSTLCPHSDHSEPNKCAPLLSLSLGSTAIFLIGDTSKASTKPIIPIYLRDCDLVIMSGECRQAFHAIPKVLNDSLDYQCRAVKRINLNVRQVY